MPEWSNGHAWRACVAARLPWVRIPPSPPVINFLKNVVALVFSVKNTPSIKAIAGKDKIKYNILKIRKDK